MRCRSLRPRVADLIGDPFTWLSHPSKVLVVAVLVEVYSDPFQDAFQRPDRFSPDVAMSIDDVIGKTIDMRDAHAISRPGCNLRCRRTPAPQTDASDY